ncbi:hypothetical protein TorRG33x02_324230, partial [Trema orientale]
MSVVQATPSSENSLEEMNNALTINMLKFEQESRSNFQSLQDRCNELSTTVQEQQARHSPPPF